MSSVFIIGQKGETDLWLVDTAAGTVRSLNADVGHSVDTELVEQIQAMRANGYEINRNVDVVIGASGSGELTSREFSASHSLGEGMTSREFSAAPLEYGLTSREFSAHA